MKNRSRTFFISLILLVLIFTTLTFSYLKSVEIIPKPQNLASYHTYSLNELIIASEMKTNPDYVPIVFKEGVDPIIQSAIRNEFIESVNESMETANVDTGLFYKYVSSNGKTIGSKELAEKIVVSDLISFDDKGNLINGESIYELITPQNLINRSNYYVDHLDGVDNADEANWRWNISESFTINYPKNSTMELKIYEVGNPGYFSSSVFDNYEIHMYVLSAAMIGSFFIISFIFIVNYKKEEHAPFLRMLPHTKIELAVVIYGSVITLLSLGLGLIYMPVARIEFTGLSQVLQISERLLPLIFDIIALTITGLFYFSIACLAFYVKSIVKAGIFKSLRTNSYLGVLFSSVNTGLKSSMEVISKPNVFKWIGIFIANNLICYALYGMGGFGFFVMVIYIILIVKYGSMKLQEVFQDYTDLEAKIDAISEGNFDIKPVRYDSIFESMSVKLDKVREGFEYAVSEEVKSQNEKNELVTNISHDLKTPLTALQNYAKLLSDSKISEADRNDYIGKVNIYTSRLSDQIEGIFEISKINSGIIDLNPVILNVVSLLEQSMFELESELELRNLILVKPDVFDEISVFMDPEKTHRIFDNLISNICKYALEGTRVYIDIESVNESVNISFKNISKNPMNFTEEEITRRFVRGDKSRSEVGSGIGLAIVKNLCEIQGIDFSILIDGDLFKVVLKFPTV